MYMCRSNCLFVPLSKTWQYLLLSHEQCAWGKITTYMLGNSFNFGWEWKWFFMGLNHQCSWDNVHILNHELTLLIISNSETISKCMTYSNKPLIECSLPLRKWFNLLDACRFCFSTQLFCSLMVQVGLLCGCNIFHSVLFYHLLISSVRWLEKTFCTYSVNLWRVK